VTHTEQSGHKLLMPQKPCTGVENWDRGSCPRDDIWDKGQADLDAEGRDGLAWGMAINPVSRRGQHQMHVHVDQVQPTLAASIAYAFHTQQKRTFNLDCKLSKNKHTMEDCDVFTGQVQPTDNFKPSVEIVPNLKHPSLMNPGPFSRAYGNGAQLTRDNYNVLWASTLVIRVPFTTDVWAVVVNKGGPAECFFVNNPNCQY